GRHSDRATDDTQAALVSVIAVSAGGLFASLSRAGIIGAGRAGRRAGFVALSIAILGIGSFCADFGALAKPLQDSFDVGMGAGAAIWRDTWRMAKDFWATGVGAGACKHGMLVYQQGSRRFFFNHAHNEYLQMLVEGGLLLVIPRRSRR